MSAPLHSASGEPTPAHTVREVACPMCAGSGESGMILRPGHREDGRAIDCSGCNRSGEVTVHVGEVDGDEPFASPVLALWCPSLGLLAYTDEDELASGNWSNPWTANRFDEHDRALLGELGAGL